MSESSQPLDAAERRVVSEALGDGPEEDAEFAVVYYKRGKPAVTGPHPDHVAERQADNLQGLIIRRTVTTTYGPWKVVDE